MSEFYIVAATFDGQKIDHWIAAGTAEIALTKVWQSLPPGWMVSLAGGALTAQQAALLGLDPNKTLKLRRKPKELPVPHSDLNYEAS